MKISEAFRCVKSFDFCRKYATLPSMHRFYIDRENIQGEHAVITSQDAKHLANVMRLTAGDLVELADGSGYHYLARIEDVSSKRAELTIIQTTQLKAESPAHITIAQGVLKDKKMDTILRQLTELGMAEWLPFFAKRSVPTPTPGKNSAKVQRWQRIAQEAMKQCGRSILPKIHPPISFKEMIAASNGYDEKVLFWEHATAPIDLLREKTACKKRILILIGPEGGFSDQEAYCAVNNGFSAFSLGRRILRAETAAITACALIQNIFGDLGKKE